MSQIEIALTATALLIVTWYGTKLINGMIDDALKLRCMTDAELLSSIEWEFSEGRSGKPYTAEYKRRQGPASKMTMARLADVGGDLSRAGYYDNPYSRELRNRCCAGVKE